MSKNASSLPIATHPRYRIALIGVGHRGYNTHFLNVQDSRSESISAVCDADRQTLDKFRAKHPNVPAYSSVADLIKNNRPDFCIVAVPHST